MAASQPAGRSETRPSGATAVPGPEDEQRRLQKAAIRAMAFPAFFVIAFSLCYLSALHSPQPHGVKVAVVGPAAQTQPVRASLARSVDSAFVVSGSPTVAQAANQVRGRDLSGAYVPATGAGHRAIVIVNSAAGAELADAVESLFRPVAAAQGAQLAVHDVRPLPAGDSTGTALFYFVIVCTLGGYLTVTILGQTAQALRPRRRFLIVLAAAVATPVLIYLIGGPLLGAYSGSAGAISAMLGVGALYVLIIAGIARALQIVLGTAAILAMMAIFVFLNFPSAGGAIPAPMLPAFWRFIHAFWVGAPAVDATRSILYFGGAGVGIDVLKLIGWLALVAIVLALPISRKLARQREHQDVGPSERATALTVGPASPGRRAPSHGD